MLLWVAIAPLCDGWLPPLWWFSLLLLPFTLWSLVTQAFVIRKWCLFCCSVVFLLWANAAILLAIFPQPVIPAIPEMALLALVFLACLVVMMEASKTIGSKERNYAKQREMAKVKYNILTIQAQLAEKMAQMDRLGFVFGNQGAPIDVGLYISISCPYCRKAVYEMKRLTDIYPDFSYRLIFTVSSDDFGEENNLIIHHLMNLYKAMDKNVFFDMLDKWFAMPQKSLEVLQATYPVSVVQDFKAEMKTLHQFNRQQKISFTPAILLNRRLLSQMYSYKDLYYITRTFNNEELHGTDRTTNKRVP